MIIQITQENIQDLIKNSAKGLVIDVYATWCGPCQQMAPTFDELAEELENKYQFASLNVDEARDIAIGYGVSSVPTFIFIKNGELKGKAIGYMDKTDLLKKIEEFLD